MSALNEKNSTDQWSDSGYVTEITYTRDYFRYQAPITMSFAAACNGFASVDLTKPFTYCDLGCGEAVTLLNLAAAYPHAQFVGVDFNPAHIDSARELAMRAELSNVTLIASDFDDFSAQSDMQFDFIAAHGVYSWVSEDVVRSLHSVIEKRLKSKGLFYFCHFVRPGGSRTELLFELMQNLMATQTGTLTQKARAAIQSANRLLSQVTPVSKRYMFLKNDIDELAKRDDRYLVHEFCNKHFRPRFFREVVQDLDGIGLSYTGSSKVERNSIRNQMSTSEALLKDLSWIDQEIHVSLISDDEFRWDVFQKDRSAKVEMANAIDTFYLDSAVFPYVYPDKVKVWNRSIDLNTRTFKQLLDHSHAGNRRIADILSQATSDQENARKTIEDMAASRLFQPLVRPAKSPLGKATTVYQFANPLSRHLFDRDFYAEGSCSFASKILGSAIVLTGFSAIACAALDDRTFDSAMNYAREIIKKIPKDQRAKIGLQKLNSNADINTAERSFRKSILPKLLKYEILRPKS